MIGTDGRRAPGGLFPSRTKSARLRTGPGGAYRSDGLDTILVPAVLEPTVYSVKGGIAGDLGVPIGDDENVLGALRSLGTRGDVGIGVSCEERRP